MDDQLTPRKLTRFLNLAESLIPNYQNKHMRDILCKFDENVSRPCESIPANATTSNTGNCESSSGILDLECCEGLSSYVDNLSLGKSTFNPGEMTGRSTEAEKFTSQSTADRNFQLPVKQLTPIGRHSVATASSIEQLAERMRMQSADVTNLMRHSVCSSQFTQVDLTADEKSFVTKEAPIPVMPSELNMNLTRNMDLSKSDTTDLSLGGYFRKRCEPFQNILPVNVNSKYVMSNVPSNEFTPEAELWSTTAVVNEGLTSEQPLQGFDMTLDSVPVRQPRKLPFTENPDIVLTNTQLNKSYIISANYKEVNILEPEKFYTPSFDLTKANTEKSHNATEMLKPSVATLSTNQKKAVEINPPNYMAAPQLQHLGVHTTAEESMQEESSLGMSAIICNYLGNESDIRASVLLNQIKHVKGQKQLNPPLKEIDINVQQNKRPKTNQIPRYCPEMDPEGNESSARVLPGLEKSITYNENVIIPSRAHSTLQSTDKDSIPVSTVSVTKSDANTGNKSPGSKSSKSQTTYYTVKENNAHSTPPSGESNLHISKVSGGSNTLIVPSPNIKYKELDKSVDWHELLSQKSAPSNEGLVEDKWVEMSVCTVHGYVGVSVEAPITVTSLTDSWLTAQIVIDQAPNRDLIVDLPRFPVLLSPRKSENINFGITSMIEMKKQLLPFTIYLKDSSLDLEIQQKGCFELDFKMPMIQTITIEGVNKGIRFQSVQEAVTVNKTFILISDCSVDLQLDLSIQEGSSFFSIGSIQEIKRSDIKKCLDYNDECIIIDDMKLSRNKVLKQRSKQHCRLSNGNAIKAALVFTAPRFEDLKIVDNNATLHGCLLMHMIATNILVNKIHITGTVGIAQLVLSLPNNNLKLDYEKSQDIKLRNSGTVFGTWEVIVKDLKGKLDANFKVSPVLIKLHPDTNAILNVKYTGPEDRVIQGIVILKDSISGVETTITVSGGTDKPMRFPIKTTYSELSWVRKGRKELKIKNDSDKKVIAKFKTYGDGFVMETSRGSGTDLLLTFGPKECKDMLIIFDPSSPLPHKGKLVITLDNAPESAKSVRFHACDAGPPPSWAGLVTCGDTALVAAAARAPLALTLHNRSRAPAFISAKLHFNLQYMSVSAKSRLVGGRCVVGARESARLTLHVDWAGVERAARDAGPAAARTLATLSVLTGAEYTRHRIIRILKQESNGEIKSGNLSEHLSRLVGPFEGEDSSVAELLGDFEETSKSLEVLVSGIQELSAQVDLTRELADDVTILISDDTVFEYKTLCD